MANCIVCGAIVPEIKAPNIKARYGIRRYCSTTCIKTQWRINNPVKDKESKANWINTNPEKRAKASSDYRKRNSGYYAEYTSIRKRMFPMIKPKWLSEWDLFFISELYDLAKRRKLEVDHIIPIKHSLVCGLHVPTNLQLLSRSENAKKSNKFKINEDIVGVLYE